MLKGSLQSYTLNMIQVLQFGHWETNTESLLQLLLEDLDPVTLDPLLVNSQVAIQQILNSTSMVQTQQILNSIISVLHCESDLM